MTTPSRLIAIVGIYAVAFLAWQSLGLITSARTSNQTSRLAGDVQDLWGGPMAQADPDVRFHWQTTRQVSNTDDHGNVYTHAVTDDHESRLSPDSTELNANMALDQRLKGLVWYSLYNVTFDAHWRYTYHGEIPNGDARVFIKLPDASAMYDDFQFQIDGIDYIRDLEANGPSRGRDIVLKPGQTFLLHVHYKTRGMGVFSYDPENSTSLTHFSFQLTTDFDSIDYPSNATSPTKKERVGTGWALDWSFAQVLSGKPMGVVTPSHIQPGELASDLSYSAPISLLLFFLVLLALGALRGLDIHPINYFAIAAAFFAFQLLFAYSVDHLPLWLAFTLSSAASVILVVTYLRLVVDARFAFREAAAAQLVYQVGFALAHFWEGYTGLTVAVLATLTLFLVMQLTGRIKWGQVLSRKPQQPAVAT